MIQFILLYSNLVQFYPILSCFNRIINLMQFEAILSDLNFQSQTTKHDKWLEASASLLKLKKDIDPFLRKMHRNLLVPILQISFFASYVLFMLNYIIELSCKIISWYNAMAFISKRMHTITIRWGHLLLLSEWNKYRLFRAAW